MSVRISTTAPALNGRETTIIVTVRRTALPLDEIWDVLVDWAELYRVDPPLINTVRKWATPKIRATNGFPDAVGTIEHPVHGKLVNTYNVAEVLTWYLGYLTRQLKRTHDAS